MALDRAFSWWAGCCCSGRSIGCAGVLFWLDGWRCKDGDLVAATHGRSFWILDDVTSLRQVSEDIQNSVAYLFKPRPAVRFMTTFSFSRPASHGKFYRLTGATMATIRRKKKPDGEMVDTYLDSGKNPPDGVIVTYYLKQKPEDEVKLTFLDAHGQEIKTFTSEVKQEQPPVPADSSATQSKKQDKEKKELRVLKEAGANRFIWDMRYPDVPKVDNYVGGESTLAGPLVAPGVYQVRLAVGDQTYTESFEIAKDPRVEAAQADLEEQFELCYKIWE